jgi:ABC-type uncharacterized transport system permease subunit
MSNHNKWIQGKIRSGWLYLVAGIILSLAGLLVGFRSTVESFDPRIITGLGILLIGIGIGTLVRYIAVKKDARSSGRLVAEELDERNTLIRARAGNRAYWVSAALIYAGLMWASFAANGKLPELRGDTLWFFLAGAVVLPFLVYIIGLVIDQQKI